MEEQKMTMFQRNKVEYFLRNGTPLPPPSVPEKPTENGSKFHGMRAKTAIKRSLETIQASGAFKYEKYIRIDFILLIH